MVQSAYKLALDKSMNSCVGEPSNGDTRGRYWRAICILNMPTKVKSFVSKYYSNESKSMPSRGYHRKCL